MSFSIEWDAVDYSYPGKKGKVMWNKRSICKIETWAFRSCACFLLQDWDSVEVSNWSKDISNSFWEFITKKHENLTWHPEEVYFLISDSQKKFLKPLWKRKEVRLRDRFTNKAHGPNDVYLFRYSKAGDWQRRVINA